MESIDQIDANEALTVRPGDTIEISSGADAGSYKILTKDVAADNLSVTVSVSGLSDESTVFTGTTGFNVIITSGTAVNLLADNQTLTNVPFSSKNYEISFIDAPFEARFADVCDLRRFVESSFIEEKTSACECEDDSCLSEDECSPVYKNQKYIPGDLYIPDGDILSAPGVPHHGDYEYANITIPVPPGTITNCSIDLYNVFIKSEGATCKTAYDFPAMKFSDGTYVGCEDSGDDTDITKGKVKFSHAICGVHVDGLLDGYGVDGETEDIETSSIEEIISENFINDQFDAFDTWTDNAGNDAAITNITHAVGPNSPAVFELITSTDSGERFGRLDLPVSSQDFEGDFVVDFTASRTVWPAVSLTNGTVSSFFTLEVTNTDGSISTLKLGWRTIAGSSTELFFSGVIENASAIVISTFDYSVAAPDAVTEDVLFRLRRIDDVITAYYITPDSLDDADTIAFGQYVRIGENPALQPGSGMVSNLAFEIAQNNTPNAGISFFSRLAEVIIRSELTSVDNATQVLIARDGVTAETDRTTLTFPLNLTRSTVITSAVIKLTSEVSGTFSDTFNVVPLDIMNANNIGTIYNIPVTQNASLISSFIPGTLFSGDVLEIDVTNAVIGMLAALGHLPGQYKGFVIEPDVTASSSLAFSTTVELEITYLDSTTGVVFKIGLSLDKSTGVVTLNTKNILYDELVEENRTVMNFGVYLKKAGFINSDVEVPLSELDRIGIGVCSDVGFNLTEEECSFIVGTTAVGSFVEGPFPCQFALPAT